MLVSTYIVERGLILPPHQVAGKPNEIKALPELIKHLALKGNQPHLFQSVQANFIPQQSYLELDKGHGRLEKRTVSICTQLEGIKPWPGLQTLIRVDAQRQLKKGGQLRLETETRYYLASHPYPEDILLVCEISDSTLNYDQDTKLSLYAEDNISNYWIFNLSEIQLETYSEPFQDISGKFKYRFKQIYLPNEIVTLPSLQSLSLDLSTIFPAHRGHNLNNLQENSAM